MNFSNVSGQNVPQQRQTAHSQQNRAGVWARGRDSFGSLSDLLWFSSNSNRDVNTHSVVVNTSEGDRFLISSHLQSAFTSLESQLSSWVLSETQTKTRGSSEELKVKEAKLLILRLNFEEEYTGSRSLDLGSTGITSIPPLGHTHYADINLRDNAIRIIPAGSFEQIKAKNVDLSLSCISKISPGAFKDSSIQRLDLSNNLQLRIDQKAFERCQFSIIRCKGVLELNAIAEKNSFAESTTSAVVVGEHSTLNAFALEPLGLRHPSTFGVINVAKNDPSPSKDVDWPHLTHLVSVGVVGAVMAVIGVALFASSQESGAQLQ